MPFFNVGATDAVGVFLLFTGLFDFEPGAAGAAFGALGDRERGDFGDCLPSLLESDFSSAAVFSSAFSSSFSSGFLSFTKI